MSENQKTSKSDDGGPHTPLVQERSGDDQPERNQLCRQLVESVQEYAIFALDATGHVLTWNAGATRIKGYASAEIVGKHFSIFYPPDAIAAGKPLHQLEVAAAEGHVEDEDWRIRKDGSRFWASVAISALRDPGGSLVGFGKVTRDLTARRLMERDLRRSEERFRLLVQGVGDYAIFMLDPTGHIQTWNDGAERLKGYTPAEIIGKHFSIFYPKADLAWGKPAKELAMATQQGRYEEEGWRVRKDGSRFWANVLITAIHDEDARLVGFAKVTRDLSERRASELRVNDALAESERRRDEAESAIRQRDDVLSIVSHDLRSPLSTISASAQLLLDPAITLPEQRQDQQLDIIVRSAHRMDHLIGDLLDVARIESGNLKISCRREDAGTLMSEVCDAFRTIVAKKTVTLNCQLDPHLPQLLVDRDRIIQALTNFLSNAVKFTPAGGRITVRVHASDDGTAALFAVSDTGPGIPEDHLPHVFDRFWQAKKTAQLGTGLGLAIAKGIAEAHRGGVSVESEAHRGATFVLSIPVSTECA